jgi:hypothetical protein
VRAARSPPIGANLFDKLIGTALDTVSNGQIVRWVPV